MSRVQPHQLGALALVGGQGALRVLFRVDLGLLHPGPQACLGQVEFARDDMHALARGAHDAHRLGLELGGELFEDSVRRQGGAIGSPGVRQGPRLARPRINSDEHWG